MIEELKNAVNWHKDKNYIISPALREDRQDSVWYNGLLYAYTYKGYRFSVYAVGDITIYYKEDTYHSIYDTDIKNDAELHKAVENNEIEWGNNNWYEMFIDKVDEKRNVVEEIDNIVIDNLEDCVDRDWIEDIVKGEI